MLTKIQNDKKGNENQFGLEDVYLKMLLSSSKWGSCLVRKKMSYNLSIIIIIHGN